ncbi:type VI secretion protein [Rubrivivax gelatinosus]|uniref:Type VI secretion protein n=1 Tax=Rubrivivax gelatinosus TaxID=28068 RepID=A0ABS1DNJ6_RUBGE|nr:type IV secretion system protein [Rubrivivax gelatinosus]MBK1611907.1 type VI secretion protein [Rubrivivax gelatinosus]MBK1711564.1 type VI secretion protein [Rubrivivax gelatinosus]MBZ8143145.1 type VI secretion protein [Rubrivivax gelatinosus]
MALPGRAFAVSVVAGLITGHAGAQGIPVIDNANLLRAVEQVMNDVTQIANQVEQIQRLQAQIESSNGRRLLGAVANDPGLRNYVPAEVFTALNAVDGSGYSGLTSTAKALRDAARIYNCEDRGGDARTACQAALARPYQHKGLLQDAMQAAAGRLAQIDALMDEIDATSDPKAIQEIQARVELENAQLAHEASQIQMLQGMADSEERIERSRERERQQQNLTRTSSLGSYLD